MHLEYEMIHQDHKPEINSSVSTDKPFIQANTQPFSLEEIKSKHIIPVFKDNEPVISHADFIEVTMSVISDLFPSEMILIPNIRLSHPIQGRIPEARFKPAKDLLEREKTIHYERSAFIIEIPSMTDTIGGNQLSLTIGGVKAYNLDNLSLKKGTGEVFKVFIGFQNKVCTNLCVSSDGYASDLRVNTLHELYSAMYNLFNSYQAEKHLYLMKQLTGYSLTEEQFAHMIGKARMYQYLPANMRAEIPVLLMGDTQISSICKDYYRDNSFCKQEDGSINLWKLYNLFTGANKSSYIDTFLDRSLNAFQFADQIKSALNNRQDNWFLN
jgi:hypothetical protein